MKRKILNFLHKLKDYRYLRRMSPAEILGMVCADCVYLLIILTTNKTLLLSTFGVFKLERKLKVWSVAYIRTDFTSMSIFCDAIDAITEAY